MPSDNYQKHIDALRSREVRPSFEEIRSLVLHEKRSRKFLVIPFLHFASASAPLLLALSVLLFPEMFGLQNRLLNHQSSDRSSSFAADQSAGIIHEQRIPNYEPRILSEEKDMAIGEEPKTTDLVVKQKTVIEKPTQKENPSTSNPKEPESTELASAPIHQVPESAINSVENNHFFTYISGGFPEVKSSVPYNSLLVGAAGIRWQVTPASSLILEVRRNSFIQKYTVNKINFHDTTLTAGGKTFHNTIGSLYPVPVETANEIFSLGAGYRLAFIESGLFIPFAQVIFGASLQGGLTSEMAGIGYSLNSRLSLELALRADQLYSSSSSPQGIFNLNASISFAW